MNERDDAIPSNILEACRGRLGLDELDTSKDAMIAKWSKAKLLREYFGWRLGDSSWGDTAIWLVEKAYKVELEKLY